MSHRSIDLLVLDLDGTVINPYSHEPIRPAIHSAVDRARALGVSVTIATGRTLDYVREHVGSLRVTVPVVTTQGAMIGDPVTGEVLWERELPLDASRQIAQWVDNQRQNKSTRPTVFYFIRREGIQKEGPVQIYQNCTADDPDFHNDLYNHLFGLPRSAQPNFEALLSAPDSHPPIKFITVNDLNEEADLVPVLQARFGDSVTISRTHPILVEGTAAGVDKGAGVLRLCQMLSVDPARVLAIGDSENDIPIFKVVGHSVAMGNASPAVKAASDWIAPEISEDGVVAALERYIFNTDDS